MPDPVSRYIIENDDLRQAAMSLQLGEGIADRIKGVEATQFIVDAEDWGDQEVEDYLGVPLKPTPAPGQTVGFDPDSPTRRNFPAGFIKAVTYHALGLLLASEYFENEPNQSESSKWALDEADKLMLSFKDKPTTRVGAGRRRNPNVHMPPNIAPKSLQQPGSTG